MARMATAKRRKATLEQRLLGTTKQRILFLLCRDRHTVAQLAARLNITDNAIRAQLVRLTRDGLVRQAGSRQGVRRPHADYEITAKARKLFPTAYEPVLRRLVDALAERLSARTARGMLRKVVQGILEEQSKTLRAKDPKDRVTEMVTKLDGSASGIELEEQTDELRIRSCSCPLASVTASHPELCGLFAQTLGEALRADVRERCDKGESPRCCFVITL
jgi:predicted ArsR family transcriptional regulator